MSTTRKSYGQPRPGGIGITTRTLQCLGLGLAAAGLLILAGTGTAPAANTGSSFAVYSGSKPLRDYAPGAVLKTRTLNYHLTGIATPLKVVQLLYRSTGSLGYPTVNVTSVIEPPIKPATVRVVSYQSFYDSLNPADEPSAAITGNQTVGGEVWTAENGLIADLLLDGITVVASDTEGQSADFAAGPVYGKNTLDSIGAAFKSHATGIPGSAKVAMLGYSGGAIATGWAAQLAPSYAPDVNKRLVGAAEGGILVDPAHNLQYISGSVLWSGVMPMSIIGLARAYKVDLEKYMSPYGVTLYKKMQNYSIASALGAYPGLTWAKLAKPAYVNPDSVAPFVSTVNKLDLGARPMPTIPMFMGQGTGGVLEGTAVSAQYGAGDGVMVAGDVRSLARKICASGDSVDYQQYDLSHVTSVPQWLPQATVWVLDRLAGDAIPNNCSSIAPGNSLALQKLVKRH